MKKLVLSIMTMAMIVAFVSCEKENLGVFNPKMKIYKVYNETDGHYLQEKWLWNELIRFLFRNRNCPISPFRNPPNPRPGQFLTFCTSSPRNWSHIFPNQMQKANVMITVRQKLILHGRKIMSNI